MRILEILAEDKRHPQPRGIDAVISYLQGLDQMQLERTYVHASRLPKVGIKPMDNMGTYEFEPVGIYTYRADDWMANPTGMPYSKHMRLPDYLHVITLKPGTHVASLTQSDQILAKAQDELPERPQDEMWYTPSGTLTRYLRDRGIGVIQRDYEGAREYIILGRDYIQNVRTFALGHAGDTRGLDQYADFLQHNPQLAVDLRLDSMSTRIQGQPRSARSRAKLKMLLHALSKGSYLTPDQEQMLVDPFQDPPTRLLDIYKKYSK